MVTAPASRNKDVFPVGAETDWLKQLKGLALSICETKIHLSQSFPIELEDQVAILMKHIFQWAQLRVWKTV